MKTDRLDPTDLPAANTDSRDAREVLVALRTATRASDDGEATTCDVVEELYDTDVVIHVLDGEKYRPDVRGFVWMVGTALTDFARLGFATRETDGEGDADTKPFDELDETVRWSNPDVAGYDAFMAETEGDEEIADAQEDDDEQGGA